MRPGEHPGRSAVACIGPDGALEGVAAASERLIVTKGAAGAEELAPGGGRAGTLVRPSHAHTHAAMR